MNCRYCMNTLKRKNKKKIDCRYCMNTLKCKNKKNLIADIGFLVADII